MSTIEKVNGHAPGSTSHAESWARAGIADAEAEAIRARTAAEIEERRIKAQAEAEALLIAAREEAEKQRIANERAALRFEREKAEQLAKIAEAEAKRQETERQAAAARAAEAAERAAVEERQAKREQSAGSWRRAALSFAVVCAIVALPVQMSAFWSPSAPWLLVAPLVLEGGAWVVLKGAAAAVDDHRPHWHYRAIAWVLAFIAAGINFAHGVTAFDLATAIGTAFASLAGPGVWDLHEHGRIRKRDGKLTWRQRREQRAAEAKAAKEKTAAEERARAEQAAAEQSAARDAEKLATERAEHFPKVWARAEQLAAALGETTVTESVWKRAYNDIEGTDPHESVDIIRSRNAAARRVLAARSEAPGSDPVKVTNAQRASQMPPSGQRREYRPPARAGIRRPGDTQRYVSAARKQAAITAKNATKDAR
ncbi:hypothetical protein ACPB9J_15920 [Streptomyces lavendulocolor]|uniref:hypothetical protein n=1 Tax=Streptomyces lavendulocolor TaxID=67316 RepID=UPI003C2D175C